MKVLRRREFTDSLVELGVQVRLVRSALGIAVPTIELTVGIPLLLGVGGNVPGLAAGALFAVFAGVLATVLLRAKPSEDPTCACLGRRGRVQWSSVAFNAVCSAVASVSVMFT